jgi:hypothetical protein
LASATDRAAGDHMERDFAIFPYLGADDIAAYDHDGAVF